MAARAHIPTARSLALDLVTAEAVEALRAVGVRSIVLKGPAIARWLYEDGAPRPYGDSDVLVDPDRLDTAARALAAIGLRKLIDARLIPGVVGHHLVLHRSRDAAFLDLHWRLPFTAAPPDTAWRLLSAGTETTKIAGVEVEVLGLPARTLHLALHAAQHGASASRPLEDLRRGVRLVDESGWRAAAELATALEARDGFAAGLRAIPEGAELAARLDLPRARLSTVVELLATGAPDRAVAVQRLVCERGAWRAVPSVLRAAFPSAEFMRFRYPAAQRGRAALAAAYGRRLASLARDAVPVLLSVVRVNVRSRHDAVVADHSGSPPTGVRGVA
jgi:hypothetical protein